MSRKCNEIEMHSPQFSTKSTEFKILLGHYKEPMSLAKVLTRSKEYSVKKWLFNPHIEVHTCFQTNTLNCVLIPQRIYPKLCMHIEQWIILKKVSTMKWWDRTEVTLTSDSWSKWVAWCSHWRRPMRRRTTSCMFGLVRVSSRYHFPTKSLTSCGMESFLGLLSPFAQHSLSSLASSSCLRWLALRMDLLLRPMHFPAPNILDPEVVDTTAASTTFLATYLSLPFPNFKWSQADAILSQTTSHPNNFLRFNTYSGMTCCRSVLPKMLSTTIFWNSTPLVLVSCNKDAAQFLPNRDAVFVEDGWPSMGVPGQSELDVCSKVRSCISDCNCDRYWCSLCTALFLRLACVF